MIYENALHLWKIPLNISEKEISSLVLSLSEEERKSATRFRFDKHRHRYIIAHAAMRKIVANHLNISTHALNIDFNKYGKPYISNNPLYFNLSHSEDIALVSISFHGQVGIDIEFLKSEIDMLGIAQRFFHPIEFEQLIKIPPENRSHYFYTCWTGKEAFLKAKGIGIANHLKMFALDLQDLNKLKIILVDKAFDEFKTWTIHTFQPQENYMATVVSQAKPEALVMHDYSS